MTLQWETRHTLIMGWSSKEHKALSDNTVMCSWQKPNSDNVALGQRENNDIHFSNISQTGTMFNVYNRLSGVLQIHFTNANIALLRK